MFRNKNFNEIDSKNVFLLMVVCISGATGLVGNELVIQSLNDPEIEQVVVLSRSQLPFEHPKLVWVKTDFDQLEHLSFNHPIDLAYCALGTTLKKAGSKEIQQKIDRDYVIQFAQTMKRMHCQSIGIISSLGSNPSSSNFYLRTKGEMEVGVIETGIDSINFIQPSLLIGPRKENRLLEKIGMYFMMALNPLLVGNLRKYRGITGIDVAAKIIALTKTAAHGIHYVDLTKK